MQPQLPAGFTPTLLAQLKAYFDSTVAPMKKRVRGLLQLQDIRGHINQAYEFREYPKMITPPSETIKSVIEEKKFRRKYGLKLPYRDTVRKVRQGEIDYEKEYWDLQDYPKEMRAKAVKVWSREEEDGLLAAWNAANPARAKDPNYAQGRWFFHASKEPVMVHSLAEEQALEPGYRLTPMEAFRDAQDALLAQVPDSPTRRARKPAQEAQEAA